MSKCLLSSILSLSSCKLVHPHGLKCYLHTPQTHVSNLLLLPVSPSREMNLHSPALFDSFSLILEIQVPYAVGMFLIPSPSPCHTATVLSQATGISRWDDCNSFLHLLIFLLISLQASPGQAGRALRTIDQTSFPASLDSYNPSQFTRVAYHPCSFSRPLHVTLPSSPLPTSTLASLL